ncbi:hypothetical protein ACFFX0_20985 [Citricoccus parietis]|uniref:Uncharacterized protein n=1 Tax=Citricoccus parietis TaxID=592307 RepID=A0ABV5G3M5_9MICC
MVVLVRSRFTGLLVVQGEAVGAHEQQAHDTHRDESDDRQGAGLV